MKHKITLAAVAIAAMALTGCSTPGAPQKSASESGTLTIWMMASGPGDSPLMADVNAEFAKAHPNVKVKIEIQQWADITTKLTTALAQSNSPDIVEIGNTNVPLYAQGGALAELDKSKFDHSDKWLAGLEGPATVGKKLFAAPLYGGTKVVMYNTDLFTAAGITQPPESMAELLDDCKTLAAANSGTANFSPFYMPGQFWYAAMPFIWGAGGEIATEKDGVWTGQMSTPASVQGLRDWKTFQNGCSTPSSVGLDESTPPQITPFADGQAAMLLVRAKEQASVLEANPALKDKLGFFVLPGKSADTPLPVMITGSDIAVAANSHNKDLAVEWLEIMTSQPIQAKMALNYNLLPVVTSFLDPAKASGQEKVALQAAQSNRAVPATPGWSTLEADGSVRQLFSSVAGDTDAATAAKTFDGHVKTALKPLG
jgi:N,N'-diacetylchitobiose transport system substrate-binding protein